MEDLFAPVILLAACSQNKMEHLISLSLGNWLRPYCFSSFRRRRRQFETFSFSIDELYQNENASDEWKFRMGCTEHWSTPRVRRSFLFATKKPFHEQRRDNFVAIPPVISAGIILGTGSKHIARITSTKFDFFYTSTQSWVMWITNSLDNTTAWRWQNSVLRAYTTRTKWKEAALAENTFKQPDTRVQEDIRIFWQETRTNIAFLKIRHLRGRAWFWMLCTLRYQRQQNGHNKRPHISINWTAGSMPLGKSSDVETYFWHLRSQPTCTKYCMFQSLQLSSVQTIENWAYWPPKDARQRLSEGLLCPTRKRILSLFPFRISVRMEPTARNSWTLVSNGMEIVHWRKPVFSYDLLVSSADKPTNDTFWFHDVWHSTVVQIMGILTPVPAFLRWTCPFWRLRLWRNLTGHKSVVSGKDWPIKCHSEMILNGTVNV